MNTILTDDEIEDAWCKYGDEMGGADQSDALRIGREIEAAVIAKLAQQEPVAWRVHPFDYGIGHQGVYATTQLPQQRDAWIRKGWVVQALYTHPAPQQADRQRVPDGWKLVPVEPGEWVFADKVLGHDSHPNHKERMRRLYRAMLAAAPEAPAVARDKLKVLADEYAAQCSEFARKLASGKPDDSMSPIAVAAGDARMALHLAIDAAPEAPVQADDTDGPMLDGEGWTITLADGHSGPGWYAHCADCPEEGAVFVAAAPEAPAQAEAYTYVSRQATKCAECGEHKHTPLRIDAMGGYVCLTCIDRKLGSLLGEFGYPEAPAQASAVDERAEFEAWALKFNPQLLIEFDGPTVHGQIAWATWQARAALEQKGDAQ